MRNTSGYIKGLATGFILTMLVVIFAVFAWKWLYPIPNADPPSNVTTSTSPASPEELTARVENLENDQAYNLRNFEWQIDQKILVLGWAALAISVIAGYMGVKSYNDLDKVIREKIRITLENELYQLDPVNLMVRIPKHHPDKDKILKRLKAAGIKNVKEYTELSDNCKVGLTVVPIENEAMGTDYVEFLDKTKPEDNDAAFVLYAANRFQIPQDIINKHVRAATANMPSTVVTAILAISRGLHKDQVTKPVREEA